VHVSGDSQTPVTGTFPFFHQDTYIGNATYTVYYEFPSSVSVGSNFTAQVSLQVNGLAGLEEYLTNYELSVELGLPSGQGLSQFQANTSPMYPGGIWGPRNITIPITQSDTGLSVGSSISASVTIRMSTTVHVGYPLLTHVTHTDAKSVGNVTITSGPPGGSSTNGINGIYFSYFTVGVGCVLVSIAVIFPKLFPERRH
jgi:hypothetical protein